MTMQRPGFILIAGGLAAIAYGIGLLPEGSNMLLRAIKLALSGSLTRPRLVIIWGLIALLAGAVLSFG